VKKRKNPKAIASGFWILFEKMEPLTAERSLCNSGGNNYLVRVHHHSFSENITGKFCEVKK
jgi:hypothetical protein